MSSLKGRTTAFAGLIATAVLIGACGGHDTETSAQPPAPQLAPAAVVAAHPYAITCGHVRDQQTWADLTREATVAIADRERFPDLSRLLATQSVYYALTEVCKQKPVTFEPAHAAAEGVRDGTFRVQRLDHDAG